MKIRIEMPGELLHRAEAEAASSGRTLSELVEEGLRRVLAQQRAAPTQTLFELMKDACGVVDSGVPDLATNKKHFEGFGRDAGHRQRKLSGSRRSKRR